MKTKHVFKFSLIGKNCSISEDVIPRDYTFDSFMSNINCLSKGYKDPKDFINKGFHALVEAIIIHFPSIGITEYNPIESTRHKFKTHGIGKRENDIVTVFSSCGHKVDGLMTDGNSFLTEYLAQSCYLEGFDLSLNKKIFNIFTDAKALHENTIKNFVDLDQTQFYGVDEIRAMIDGNIEFWNEYRDSLIDAMEEITPINGEFSLYDFQSEGVAALITKNDGRCQVILPTGGGKTEIMMEHSLYKIKKAVDIGNPKPKVLFVAPRITLGKQGINKIVNRIRQYALKGFTIINFTSGEYDNDVLARMCSGIENVINTTSIDDLRKAINSSNGPILVFTTYHSVYKIVDARIQFILTNADEAHNIVKGRSIPKASREALTSELLLQNSPMIVYYTATQAISGLPDTEPPMEVTSVKKYIQQGQGEDNHIVEWHSRKGYGMDNINLFGPVIYRKKPIELIHKGVIVRPQVCHYTVTRADIKKLGLLMLSPEDLTNNAELNAKLIWESYLKIEEQNEKDSCNAGQNGVKYLIKCASGKSFYEILNSKTWKEYQAKYPDVRIFGISSDWGVFIDGKEYPKTENSVNRFMFEMQEAKPADKVIVLHIAMIGEGWDVPGINAILALNEMGDITSSQTLGRGMRLHDHDRKRLKSGEIVSDDCYNGKFFKPWCYVVIIDYEGLPNLTKSKIESMVESIHTNIGYYPFEQFIDEGYSGTRPFPGERDKPKTYDVPDGYSDKFICDIVRSIEERKAQALLEKAKQAFESTLASAKDGIKKIFSSL